MMAFKFTGLMSMAQTLEDIRIYDHQLSRTNPLNNSTYSLPETVEIKGRWSVVVTG